MFAVQRKSKSKKWTPFEPSDFMDKKEYPDQQTLKEKIVFHFRMLKKQN